MNRSEHQQLIDEIIGEAALTLLQQAGPVNTQALLDQLQRMKDQSAEPTRCEAVAAAINEVRNSHLAGKKQRDEPQQRDNVHQLFASKAASGSDSKH